MGNQRMINLAKKQIKLLKEWLQDTKDKNHRQMMIKSIQRWEMFLKNFA